MSMPKCKVQIMCATFFKRFRITLLVLAALISISTLIIILSRLLEINITFIDEAEKESRLGNVEITLAKKLYGDRVLSLWSDIPVGDEIWRAHYLTTRQASGQKHLPVALLVHGYGATATLGWRNIILPLSLDYEVFAVDLPGFGRSGISSRLLADNTSREEVLSSICDFMDGFQAAVNISEPFVIAHSFGGFISTHCIARNPLLASRLLLADVPGFFSTNGGFDYLWAGFFSFGLPHSVVRPFGNLGKSAIGTALDVLNIDLDDLVLDYWHLLQLSDSLMSDVLVRKFILHKYVYAIGTGVALVPLLNLTQPVLLATGSLDQISPPHQGQLISEISGIEHVIIPGAGHVPYILNNGTDFLQAIYLAEKQTKPKPLAATIASCLLNSASSWSNFICHPSPHVSDFAVSRMYRQIRSIVAECIAEIPQYAHTNITTTAGSSSSNNVSASTITSGNGTLGIVEEEEEGGDIGRGGSCAYVSTTSSSSIGGSSSGNNRGKSSCTTAP